MHVPFPDQKVKGQGHTGPLKSKVELYLFALFAFYSFGLFAAVILNITLAENIASSSVVFHWNEIGDYGY